MKNKAYRLLALLCILTLCFTACGKSSDSASSTADNSPSATVTTDPEQTDGTDVTPESPEDSASGEDPVSDSDSSQTPEDGDAEVVVEPHYSILVVSTGSTSEESNQNSIGAIETAIFDQCPEYEIRRAFSDPEVVAALAGQEEPTDSVEAALDRCVTDGVTHLIVQPTYLTKNEEYEALEKAVASYRTKFEKLVLGEPLLSVEDDYYYISVTLSNLASDYDDGATGVIYLGENAEKKGYKKLQGLFDDGWGEHCYIASVDDDAAFQKILKKVKKAGYKRIMLIPVVASVSDEMAEKIGGKTADSWKSRLLENGVKKVKAFRMGLGEIPGVTEIYAAHMTETSAAVY